MPRGVRVENRGIPAGTSGQAGVLSRSARPRREETARTSVHRRVALRHEGQRGGGIRLEPLGVARAHRRIPNGAARPKIIATQAA